MNKALKLQWYVGERPNIDISGSEPTDEHGTLLEMDPATPELIALAQLEGEKFNDLAKHLLAPLKASSLIAHLIPSDANIGVFLMDSDGRS